LKELADLRAERIAEQDEEASDEQDEPFVDSEVPPPSDATEPPMSDNPSSEEVATGAPAATDSSDSEILSLDPETDAAQDGPETLPEPLKEDPSSAHRGAKSFRFRGIAGWP
jgi:hypothetical protein